jgi:2-methylcitrate dehydratase PrpD
LKAPQVRHVLSYAAQQASGISCWMRDPEHVEKAFDFGGMPARNGVTAAAMAAHGLSGVEDVFSGERSFFVAYPGDPQALVRGLGETFEILNASIKRWSVGSPIQAPLDSLIELMKQNRFVVGDVKSVVVRVAHQGANTVDNRDMPDICMQHMCAVMLLDGTVSFKSSHDEKRMRDRRVVAVREKVQLLGDDAMSAAMPSRQGIVELELADGRRLRHHTRAVRGTPDNPMTRAEVDAKSYDLLAPAIGRGRARKLCDAVWGLDEIDDVRSLRPLLRV